MPSSTLGTTVWSALVLGSLSTFVGPSAALAQTEPTPIMTLVVEPTPPGVSPPALTTCPAGLECLVGADGMMRPYQRVEEHRMNTGLVVTGAVMLGAAWLLNIGGSALGTLLLSLDPTANAGDYFGWSLVPLIGPIAQMFQLGDEHWQIPILAVIEAVEVVGVILAAVGTAGEDVVTLEPVAGLTVVPWATGTAGGAFALGRF